MNSKISSLKHIGETELLGTNVSHQKLINERFGLRHACKYSERFLLLILIIGFMVHERLPGNGVVRNSFISI